MDKTLDPSLQKRRAADNPQMVITKQTDNRGTKGVDD